MSDTVIRHRLVPKDRSILMRVIGTLLKPVNSSFMEHYWTTLGNVIYYPVTVKDPDSARYNIVKTHEMEHIKQFRKYGMLLMGLFYLFLPLPFLFSGRWFIERGPYMVNIRAGAEIDKVVDVLWSGYGAPWPKSWMRKWFNTQLEKEKLGG